jgi:hypothetical protein
MDGRLYISDRNGEVYCAFHRTSVGQGMRWRTMTPAEREDWAAFVRAEGHGSPCEACEYRFGGIRPDGPLAPAEAVFA